MAVLLASDAIYFLPIFIWNLDNRTIRSTIDIMTGISEKLRGIVTRVTYHNPVNGWSVLKVQSFDNYNEQVTVTVHQTKVFAGATMEFHGAWTSHPQFGRQFKATEALERKPASAAALEKYLGSGLISGVGPKIARRIVQHFSDKTHCLASH